MPITGGNVTFEQSRKLAEYENRKVSISFSVTDDQDAENQTVAALSLARSMVFVALGITAEEAVASAPPAKPKKAKTPPATPPAEQAKVTAGLAAALDPSVVSEATVVEDKPAPQIRISPESRVDPAAMDDSLFTAADAPAAVTDAELLSAVTRKNVALQVKHGEAAPSMIRTLIGKFAKQAKDITADKRPLFLTELAALA